LSNDGTPTNLTLQICDAPGALADRIDQVILRVVLFGAREGDNFGARLNGVALPPTEYDFQWKDPQIFSPGGQPASGGDGRYKVNSKQNLLRIDFVVPPRLCRLGENQINVWIDKRIPYVCTDIALEKLEIHLLHR